MRKERKLGLLTVFLVLFLAGDIIVFDFEQIGARGYAQEKKARMLDRHQRLKLPLPLIRTASSI
jgi:hypothetical protein